MNISREIKKVEAINRMRELKIYKEAIRQFKDSDIVMVSEPPLGGLFWLNKEEKKAVTEFEKEYNALVYMVVRANTIFGMLDALLYVSDHIEEWEMDNEDLYDGYVMSYVINKDCPDCSEFGSIAVKSIGGGLVRIA